MMATLGYEAEVYMRQLLVISRLDLVSPLAEVLRLRAAEKVKQGYEGHVLEEVEALAAASAEPGSGRALN